MTGQTVITLGNFDGVHVGHKAILAQARRMADAQRLPVIALTFDPFPLQILRPAQAPGRLSTLAERETLLRQAGADEVVVIEPTTSFLQQSAELFLQRLAEEFHPLAMVEGGNFRFGQGRAGDVRMLAALGKELGFEMVVLDPVEVSLDRLSAAPVSSTLVRWLVSSGRVWEAAIALGRPYSLQNVVVPGEQRGRTLGIPTANFDLTQFPDRVLPADGVYAGQAVLEEGGVCAAAISIGHKPTFGRLTRVMETHLLDFQGDLYGKTLRVDFLRWIREQQPFPHVEALRHRLATDLRQVRQWRDLDVLSSPMDRQQLTPGRFA